MTRDRIEYIIRRREALILRLEYERVKNQSDYALEEERIMARVLPGATDYEAVKVAHSDAPDDRLAEALDLLEEVREQRDRRLAEIDAQMRSIQAVARAYDELPPKWRQACESELRGGESDLSKPVRRQYVSDALLILEKQLCLY